MKYFYSFFIIWSHKIDCSIFLFPNLKLYVLVRNRKSVQLRFINREVSTIVNINQAALFFFLYHKASRSLFNLSWYPQGHHGPSSQDICQLFIELESTRVSVTGYIRYKEITKYCVEPTPEQSKKIMFPSTIFSDTLLINHIRCFGKNIFLNSFLTEHQ